jgi:predicted molibdopterin-dependent oxidoreductase YjgC
MLPLGMGYPGHGKVLAQAVINLALLTGKIGKEGCGVLIMGEKNNSQGAADLQIHPVTGGRDAMGILDGCTSGAIKTLYVVGENPVVSYPNRKKVEAALDAVEFLVVQDLFMTETASKADVVLPACSFAEKDGTFTSVGKAVQRVRKALAPVGMARSDFDIFNTLYSSLGCESLNGLAEAFAEIASTVPSYSGLSFDGLGENGAVYPVTNKSQFIPSVVSGQEPTAGAMALVTGSALNHCGTLSLYGEGPMYVCPEGYLELNRGDAKKLGVEDGQSLTVKSSLGEVKLKAKVSMRLPEGVVFAPYHFSDMSINGITSGAAVTWVTISK